MTRRAFMRVLAGVSLAVTTACSAVRAGVARVVALRPRHRAMTLPPLPKWNEITDDIDSVDFARRSRDFERSLLPKDIAFPRAGQIWEAVHDCEVGFAVLFTGPPGGFSGKEPNPGGVSLPFGKAKLSRGERVRIEFTDDPKPLSIHFKPLRYADLHESIVPEDLRKTGNYSHYFLTARTAHTPCCLQREPTYFTEAFRLVEDVP